MRRCSAICKTTGAQCSRNGTPGACFCAVHKEASSRAGDVCERHSKPASVAEAEKEQRHRQPFSGSGGRWMIGNQLGASGKDKTVFEATTSAGTRAAVACFHKNRGTTLAVEASFQRRAASIGFAPQVLEVDTKQRRLVQQLMSGGTLVDVATRQGGRLTLEQQERIRDMLERLGAPPASGGAGLRHADSGNPSNYVTDEDATLFLIDFSPPHCREMSPSFPEDANLGSIGMLLWHPERGMLRRGWLIEPPLLLLREYRLFCHRRGVSDPMDPAPHDIPPLPPAARAAARVNISPPRAAASARRRTVAHAPHAQSATPIVDLLDDGRATAVSCAGRLALSLCASVLVSGAMYMMSGRLRFNAISMSVGTAEVGDERVE
jgi:predicted Ser/Thr protein kinase